MGPSDSELPGIVGLAIFALIFAACWGAERLMHRSFPDSGKFFWGGSALGAGAGSIIFVAYVVCKNYQVYVHSLLDNLVWLLPTGAAMGLIPGGILGLMFGWIRSKFKKNR